MKSLTIAGANLRRFTRRPRNFIIVGLGPLLLIFLLGAAFGGGATVHLDVLAPHTPYAEQLLRTIGRQQGVSLQRVNNKRELRSAVEYGEAGAGVVVPSNYDQTLRAGDIVQLPYYAQRGVGGPQVLQLVQSGVAEENGEVTAAVLLKHRRNFTFAQGFARAQSFNARIPKVVVRTIEPSGKTYPKALQRFTGGASTQLLLFIFITSLANSAALVETRRLGIARRMIATPTPVRSVIFGEALARIVVAVIQAVLIIVTSMLLFGVEWGNGPAVIAVTAAFCLVSAGFAMLLGSTLKTEQQALAFGVMFGLSLAALGGSMVPLQLFPKVMQDIAHISPHGWANEAFSTLTTTGGTITNVLPQIGVLVIFAAVAFSLATWQLRQQLDR